jgi:hypothetical protein
MTKGEKYALLGWNVTLRLSGGISPHATVRCHFHMIGFYLLDSITQIMFVKIKIYEVLP